MADPSWRPASLPGVMRRTITFLPDDRGSFGELWRDSSTSGLGDASTPSEMRQANLSRSRPRVLRGLHFHRHQADLWIVLEGHPFIALVDLRDAIAERGQPVVEAIEANPGDAFYLPAGVAHGFYATDELTLVYLVTNEYDGSDELGFAWDDPEAAVPWPSRDPVLSPRDAAAPSLQALLERLRR